MRLEEFASLPRLRGIFGVVARGVDGRQRKKKKDPVFLHPAFVEIDRGTAAET